MKRSGGPSWWWKRTNHFISEVVPKGKEAQQDRGGFVQLCRAIPTAWSQSQGTRRGEEPFPSEAAVPSQQEQSQSRTRLVPETFLARRREERSSSPVLLCPPSFQNFQLYNDMVPGRALLTGLEDISWARPWQHDDHGVERLLTALSRPSVIQLHALLSRGERQVFQKQLALKFVLCLRGF